MQRCGLCRYVYGKKDYLFCRRYPPQSENGRYWYPDISESDWCGEYKSATAAKKAEGFTPPSIRDIREYCTEIESQADPAQIFNHYTANGWIRGKTKMKDWKAAVRGWSSREGR